MTGIKAGALILFGITGDLARRKLFPALYAMTAAGDLHIPVVGVGRTPGDDADLRRRAADALAEAGIGFDQDVFHRLAANLCYVSGDYRDPETYSHIKRRIGDRPCAVAYLAIPPGLFDDVVRGLASSGLHQDGRLVVEKPFGRDTKSAEELSEIIHRYYSEPQVFRIDHFLGKEAVQNLLVYRFSNTVLEPIWNRHYVRGVQITIAEDFGVEGRGGFYDTAGALRDVVQNHLLVLVSLLAMEPPVSDAPKALQDEQVKVLRSIRPLEPESVIRGQYEGYGNEHGVDPDSETETFFAARLEIDSWRWAGVPWILRTGKAMSTTVTEAVIEFLRPPRLHFVDSSSTPGPNRLAFRSKPEERITLSMQSKRPGQALVSEPVDLALEMNDLQGRSQDAYHRLLEGALNGDQTLFASEDGVMEAWRIVQPVIDNAPPWLPYQQGSWGPEAADGLLGSEWEWITKG